MNNWSFFHLFWRFHDFYDFEDRWSSPVSIQISLPFDVFLSSCELSQQFWFGALIPTGLGRLGVPQRWPVLSFKAHTLPPRLTYFIMTKWLVAIRRGFIVCIVMVSLLFHIPVEGYIPCVGTTFDTVAWEKPHPTQLSTSTVTQWTEMAVSSCPEITTVAYLNHTTSISTTTMKWKFGQFPTYLLIEQKIRHSYHIFL